MLKKLQKMVLVGPNIMFWATLFHYRNTFGQYKHFICSQKHKYVTAWLLRNLSFDFSKYQFQNESLDDKKIDTAWVCWWDGEDDIPSIPKLCIESVRQKSGMKNIVFINKDNYKDYVSIPKVFVELHEQGLIPIQVFMDTLRISLLMQNGGLWLDATVLATNRIDNTLCDRLYTIKHGNHTGFVSNGKWTAYVIGGRKNHILFQFMLDAFEQYFSKYNLLVDYFLIDYLISIAYTHIPEVKIDIDNIPTNNVRVTDLQRMLHTSYNKNEFDNLLSSTKLHKLDWRTNTKSNREFSYYDKLLALFCKPN